MGYAEETFYKVGCCFLALTGADVGYYFSSFLVFSEPSFVGLVSTLIYWNIESG